MRRKKVCEVGFYDIYEIRTWRFFIRIVYEINYDRFPLKEICAKWEKLK